jgi:hypothetical protein
MTYPGPTYPASPGSPGVPSGPPAGGPSKSDIRPKRAWYWIATAIIVLGASGAIGWFVATAVYLVGAPDSYAHVAVPGEGSIQIKDAGQYTIYGETTRTYVSSSSFSRPLVTIADASGSSVDISPTYSSSFGSSSYSNDGLHGYPIGTFRVDRPGAYQVTVKDPLGAATSPTPGSSTRTTIATDPAVTRIAVGRDETARALRGFLGSTALGVVAFIVGAIMLIVTGVKRSRSRRRLFPPASPAIPRGPYGYPMPGPAAYPGPYPGPYGQPGHPGQPGQPGSYPAPPAPGYAPAGWAAPPGAGGPPSWGPPGPGSSQAPPAGPPLPGPWTAPGSAGAPPTPEGPADPSAEPAAEPPRGPDETPKPFAPPGEGPTEWPTYQGPS